MIVAITRPGLPGGWQDILAQAGSVRVWDNNTAPTADEFAELAAEADAILTMSQDLVDGGLLDACPRVKVIGQASMGYDNIDVAELDRRGVVATNTPGVLQETTADLTFALMLAAARNVVAGDALIRAGGWREVRFDLLLGNEVHGATLGLIGYGQIGKAVARRAKGFDMTVVHHDPFASSDEISTRVELGELLERADFVSLHAMLTPETYHVIDAERLAAMKPTAILVNAARGPLVDEAALFDALVDGTIAGAALDVFEREPLTGGEPLLTLPNVTVMPHLGSATHATRGRMVEVAARNIVEVLAGRPALSPVTTTAVAS